MRFLQCFTALVVISVLSGSLLADPRPFTFVYDTYSVGKAQAEYEQWVTYNTHKSEDHGFNQFQLRHELEYGLAENFDIAVYFLQWSHENSNDKDGTNYDGGALEGILYLMNPAKDAFGLAIYGEIGVAEDELEFEQKLLVQKDIGKWTLAYNLILETELEGIFDSKEENEVEGVLGHAFGVSYGLTPQWSIGGEALIESAYEDWSKYEGTTVYAGPVFSFVSGSHWWVTITPMFQLSDEDSEPDFKIRMIAGWEF